MKIFILIFLINLLAVGSSFASNGNSDKLYQFLATLRLCVGLGFTER